MNKVVNNFNYLIDLHTASFGRVNSYYVRADMNDPVTATMARLQYPQIVLHNSGQDGTLRSAAAQKGIKSITVEIGNPQQFQDQFIHWSYKGLLNILEHLGMYNNDKTSNNNANNINDIMSAMKSAEPAVQITGDGTRKQTIELVQGSPVLGPTVVSAMGSHGSLVLPPSLSLSALVPPLERRPYRTVVCSKGFWTYTRTGGVMEVYPVVNSFVRKGALVARIKNIFGTVIDEYFAPCDGMVC
jgi:predicted deacylase